MSDSKIQIIVYSILLVVLLLLSFFFSSSDMAYGSVDLLKFESAIKDKPESKSLRRGYKLSKNYDSTISTILLLNDTVNAGLDSLSTLLGVQLAITILNESYNVSIGETWGLVASLICLVVKIVFGEIVAKSIGKIYNFRLATFYSGILTFCSYLFFPITFVVAGFGKILSKPMISHINDVTITDDVLHEMVDEIEEEGTLDETNASLLHEAVRYTTTEAYECMTPRVDLYAIDIDDDPDTLIHEPEFFRYSKVPVYKDTIDNIVGIINTKDVMISILKGKPVVWEDYLKDVLRFPRSKEINDILSSFVKKKTQVALIMDEYGGVEGIITMEDILEEIVGEIWDENDDPNVPYIEKKDHSYIIDGSFTLKDFCSLFDIDFDKIDTEYVTIGGFLTELKDDHFCKVGDVIEFQDLKIEVIAMEDQTTVNKIHVIAPKKEEEEERETLLDRLDSIGD